MGIVLPGMDQQGLKDLDGNAISLPADFYYMTCHRQENTDEDKKLDQIFQAMDCLDAPVIYPAHPRSRDRA